MTTRQSEVPSKAARASRSVLNPAYGVVILFGVVLVLLVYQMERAELDRALETWRRESHVESLVVADRIQSQFNQVYQGLRTLARLPGVRNIDRYGENFSANARTSAQEIYNNLAHNVSMSEVYFVPLDFDPDKIDPRTGKLQEPITTFDQLIIGRTADGAAAGKGGNDIPEIEIFEYRQMKAQLDVLKKRFAREEGITGLSYPAISSREVITCDNTQYSPTHPNDADRSGILYSVPFYGPDGRLKGMVTGIILTNVIRKMLPEKDHALYNKATDYLVMAQDGGTPAGNKAHILKEERAENALYSDVIDLKILDSVKDWKLWVTAPDEKFWQQAHVVSIKRQTWILYVFVLFLVMTALTLVTLHRRRSRRIEETNAELEERVAARTQELESALQEAEDARERIQDEVAKQKSLARELDASRRQAEAANVAKSSFLAIMSHELRTPMNGVLGMADLIARTELTGQQREFVQMLQESGHSLLNLLNDILDLSKIEAGHVELENRDFSVAELLEATVRLWAHAAHDKGIAFSVENALTGDGIVRGDRNRLRQVLNNLVGNAIKFTAEGRVQVHASEMPRDDAKIQLRFEVRDTGIGIAEEQKEMVFRPFTQADGSITRTYGGTGLGLTICKNLAGLLGGEIGLDSTPGEGSIFWFTVLLERGNRQQKGPEAAGGDAASPPDYDDDRRLHILIADDNPLNQRIVSWMLAPLNCQYDVVSNGIEAVAAATRSSYDLVLMDVQMPDMDGVAATRQIRSLGGTAGEVPIIALTANAMQGDREKYLEAGMTDYISKPIDQRELLYVIANCTRVAMPDLNDGETEPRPGDGKSSGSMDEDGRKAADDLIGDIDHLLDGTGG